MSKFSLICISIMLLFSGCSFFEAPKPTPAPVTAQATAKPKPIKSALKGFIKELTYQDDKYCYYIISSDTANLKLKDANFCSTRYYYDKGDLVYATFIGERLESMLLIREGSSHGGVSGIKKPRNDAVKGRKNIKTDIALPSEERISF